MSIAIIDYGSGNLHSAAKAFEKACENTPLTVEVTADPDVLTKASHIVLPGVGAFGDCVAGLKAVDGMVEALEEQVLKQQKPFFGICVGMQMMLERGLEHGDHKGLGWIEGQVVPITPSDPNLKIPHMGWNALNIERDHPVFSGIANGDHAYFVHSFHAQCANADYQLATVGYSGPICACIGKDNMIGTQFHPEKSHKIGLKLLENFVRTA